MRTYGAPTIISANAIRKAIVLPLCISLSIHRETTIQALPPEKKKAGIAGLS